MSEAASVKLSGGTAWIVLAAMLAFGGYKYVNAYSTLDTEGATVIKRLVASDYQRYQLGRTGVGMEKKGEMLLSAEDIRFRNVSARGGFDDMIIRVEIEPHPAQPPEAEQIRYFRMEYSTLIGWRHKGRATALSYYLKLF